MGAQNGKICIIGLDVLIGMPVDNGKVVVVIFLADKATGILAKVRTLFLNGFG